MAGMTVSFVANPKLAARVEEIARVDGATPSQTVARASALGTLLGPAARRTLCFVLEEGGEDAERQLAALMTKAMALVGNSVIERKLLTRAREQGLDSSPDSEDEIAAAAVNAVAEYRRVETEAAASSEPPPGPASSVKQAT